MKKTPLVIAGLALALTACGSTVHPVAAHTTAPAVAYTPPPAPAYTPPPVSPLQNWWDNGGSTDWTTVESDLQQVQSDGNNGDQAAVMADGQQLRTDALAAAKDHPPWSADKHAYYFGAMGAMAFAGLEMEFGNWSKAASFMKTANGYVTKFTTEAGNEGLDVSG